MSRKQLRCMNKSWNGEQCVSFLHFYVMQSNVVTLGATAEAQGLVLTPLTATDVWKAAGLV